MAHFVPADRAFTCHECGEAQAANTLTMHVVERGPGTAPVQGVALPRMRCFVLREPRPSDIRWRP